MYYLNIFSVIFFQSINNWEMYVEIFHTGVNLSVFLLNIFILCISKSFC